MPSPSPSLGLLIVPAPTASRVSLILSPLSARDMFDPSGWRAEAMAPSGSAVGHWEIDLDALHLDGGAYEYEFLVVDPAGTPGRRVADPYAEELTRFGGYRGVFHISGGKRLAGRFLGWTKCPRGSSFRTIMGW